MFWKVHPRAASSRIEPLVVEAGTQAKARRRFAEARNIKSTSHMDVVAQGCSAPGCREQAIVVYKDETKFKGPKGALYEVVRVLEEMMPKRLEIYFCSTHNRRFISSIFKRLRELEDRLDDLESR